MYKSEDLLHRFPFAADLFFFPDTEHQTDAPGAVRFYDASCTLTRPLRGHPLHWRGFWLCFCFCPGAKLFLAIWDRIYYTIRAYAGVMELVDVADSKSAGSDTVPVRARSPAPSRSKLCIACSDFFQKSERTHSAAPPFQPRPSGAGLASEDSNGSDLYCLTAPIGKAP